MEFTARTIADLLKGEIAGNPEVTVNDVSKIEEGKEGTLSFLANPKYEKYIYSTDSSIVLVNKEFVPEKEVKPTLIRVDNAYKAFAKLLDLYEQSRPQKTGISSLSSIHSSATLGKDVYVGDFACISENAIIGDRAKIYPQVYIGDDVEIKENTILYPGVKVYRNCKIGANCVIHAGVIIGSDGFGFAPQDGTQFKKVPQIGNVIIEDNVELGANVTIDRATMGSTIIRRGVKLDNLIQIAHNVEIGQNTVMAAQSGIAGSTKIGNNCMIAAQAGIIGHITLADEVKIGAQSGVVHDVKNKGDVILGSPAFNINESKRSIAVYRRLPELRSMILQLRIEVEELKKKS